MSRRGKRYTEEEPRLNMKKVFATLLAIVVFAMVIYSLNNILFVEITPKDISVETAYFSAFDGDKWGVIDNKGEDILPISNNEMYIIPDKNKDLFINTYSIDYDNETYVTKVFNKEGKEILTKYDQVEALENTDGNNVWYESNILKYRKDNKYGLIDFEGNEILKPEYDDIYALKGTEKCIIVIKDGKKGLVSSLSGQLIIEPQYVEINAIKNNYENGFLIKNEDNKYGIISSDRKNVLNFNFDEIKEISDTNYYVVVKDSKIEIIDSKENVILDNGFENVIDINHDKFIVVNNSKYGVIDKNGKTIVDFKYDDVKFGSTDSYIVKENTEYNIIKNDEKKLTEKYIDINYNQIANIYIGEKSDYKSDIIDKDAKLAIKDIIVTEFNVDNGYIRVKNKDFYEYYNFKLEKKDNIEILKSNTLFLIKENGKYGYVNKNGDRVVDCKYDEAKEQNEYGYCAVKSGNLWGCLGADGTEIVKPSRELNNNLIVDFIEKWNLVDNMFIDVYTK